MKKEQINGLEFNSSATELSLGVELELQVLDGDSLLLTPRASEIIELCDDNNIVPEFFQSTIEIVSGVGLNAHEVQDDLRPAVYKAYIKANQLNLKLSSTGTHPLADYRDRLVTPSKRYHDLIDRNQWLIRRMAVYGMHIHLGMPSGDACIKYNSFFMHLLPHILALSGSSPFWQGMYTGLSSCRPTTYEALPTAGMPYLVKNWLEFQKLYSFLLKSKAINSMKDLWWDLRPSPQHGTLELRFCDEPATLKEALAIVAFVHALSHWFRDHEEEWNHSQTSLKHWIFRENKWRSIRYGLHAQVVVARNGKTKLLYKDIQDWIKAIEPYVKELKYVEHINVIKEIIEKGNSSERQYKIFEATNDLKEVIRHNVKEFESGHPLWL
ncbi:YbdK family carboxylate-amine ligase [Chryseolinea sp. H1M3-3]|uniref:carboxylate-amine ligase n=1 Tax=Chryseolinea sp. H1M3-3 TaxID=3034144 RepID=UPI0023ED93AB|nr:YbdK family carboxylate-amine ligase [Chryseolinea sp. H1M3-3]